MEVVSKAFVVFTKFLKSNKRDIGKGGEGEGEPIVVVLNFTPFDIRININLPLNQERNQAWLVFDLTEEYLES